ncbi:MAG TPA: VOC family protein [Euzebya sp.]|nr:VOC family protein [Euzebya sp.]
MAVDPLPAHMSGVTPALVQSDCAAAIDWYVEVFGARETSPRMTGPDGKVGHAELSICGSTVMMGDEWPEGPITSPTALGGTAVTLFVYAADAPGIWDRAIAGGAEVIFPYELQFYGDEGGRIRDPFGHQWGIGRHVEDVSEEEMARRSAAFYEADNG